MLCRLLNALAPSTPVDAMRADDASLLDEPEPDRVLRKHNHVAFVRGAKDLGLDDDDMFSLDDLGGLRGDPSRVLRCLTALKWRTDASLNDAARKENSSAGNPFGPGKTLAALGGNPFGEPAAPAAAPRPPLASLGNVKRLRRGPGGVSLGQTSTIAEMAFLGDPSITSWFPFPWPPWMS